MEVATVTANLLEMSAAWRDALENLLAIHRASMGGATVLPADFRANLTGVMRDAERIVVRMREHLPFCVTVADALSLAHRANRLRLLIDRSRAIGA